MAKKLFTFLGSVEDFPVSPVYKKRFQESESYRNSCILFARGMLEGAGNLREDVIAALDIATYITSKGENEPVSTSDLH